MSKFDVTCLLVPGVPLGTQLVALRPAIVDEHVADDICGSYQIGEVHGRIVKQPIIKPCNRYNVIDVSSVTIPDTHANWEFDGDSPDKYFRPVKYLDYYVLSVSLKEGFHIGRRVNVVADDEAYDMQKWAIIVRQRVPASAPKVVQGCNACGYAIWDPDNITMTSEGYAAHICCPTSPEYKAWSVNKGQSPEAPDSLAQSIRDLHAKLGALLSKFDDERSTLAQQAVDLEKMADGE